MSKTPDVSALVQSLRQATKDLSLPDEPDILENDETYIRFLKSRNWDLDATEKMLRKSVTWRTEFRPSTIQCTACSSYPGAHTLVPKHPMCPRRAAQYEHGSTSVST
ncbi:unnamed protein product [Echinostoma caproni]|uniref:CRAL_TRIO_N domain-containing protein n=1 Tax=Echinostoma caproni TaxID=27848 RepID=A0A182ZZU9_9TREM|nr:unnamed protein product [Echinostoma caproni]